MCVFIAFPISWGLGLAFEQYDICMCARDEVCLHWGGATTVRHCLFSHIPTLFLLPRIRHPFESLGRVSFKSVLCRFSVASWAMRSSYRYRLEGIFSINFFLFGPLAPYDFPGRKAKSFAPVLFSPHQFFRGDAVLVREFLFPAPTLTQNFTKNRLQVDPLARCLVGVCSLRGVKVCG